ncbi:MAG: response regulator transcription factor [Clostridia bacterium]|jgi:DNA-binding response OmpR family regulator|nr:response regulator transcription factor [Clostridia bacterium]MBQ6059669.1 response regulator transcription factor [Clostridia bacterium]
MVPTAWRILIAEDDVDLNNGITFYFNSQGYKCLQAFDGAQALELFENNIVNLAILDVMMPVKDGYEVLRSMRSHSNVPIIMLTALSEERDKLEAFSGGCDDYLSKPFSLKELEARVSALITRTYRPDHKVISDLTFGALSVNTDRREISLNGVPLVLKRKEYELLYFLLCNPGRAFSREALIEKVWSESDINDYRTVDSHVKRLRKLLGDYGDCIQTVWGLGYKLVMKE